MTAEKTIMCSSGVRFYPVQEFSRLAELNFAYVPCFPLFHVPHDGNEFPEELMKAVTVPRDVFYSYHDKMRDKNVSALIPQAYATQSSVVKFPVSRLLCDPERFIGEEEIMEKYGMGFCYERAYDGTVIKSVTEELKDKTLPYYYRHHDEVDKLCRQHPVVLLFDLHSYSDEIVPEGFIDSSRPTPDVCIGITEKKYTPNLLVASALDRFKEAGISADINYPYVGCYVPNIALKGEAKVYSIMLEFNRRVYLNSDGSLKEDRAALIRDVIQQIIVDCVEPGITEQTT